MGCYCCGTRQTDPVKGASPWQRGVAGGEQVLGCPACQASGAWEAALDRCASCGSVKLVRRLGDTVCRACGHTGDAVAGPDPPPPRAVADRDASDRDVSDRPLAEEVAAALDRCFGRD